LISKSPVTFKNRQSFLISYVVSIFSAFLLRLFFYLLWYCLTITDWNLRSNIGLNNQSIIHSFFLFLLQRASLLFYNKRFHRLYRIIYLHSAVALSI
jgi:hypothetical protein